MTSQNKMDQFFMRNCYSENERNTVKGSLAYQRAVENDDTIQAQEIATKIQESSVRAAVWDCRPRAVNRASLAVPVQWRVMFPRQIENPSKKLRSPGWEGWSADRDWKNEAVCSLLAVYIEFKTMRTPTQLTCQTWFLLVAGDLTVFNPNSRLPVKFIAPCGRKHSWPSPYRHGKSTRSPLANADAFFVPQCSGLGLVSPSAGYTTTADFTDTNAPLRFYRVDAVRPLTPWAFKNLKRPDRPNQRIHASGVGQRQSERARGRSGRLNELAAGLFNLARSIRRVHPRSGFGLLNDR
jgi:hypothetical protein